LNLTVTDQTGRSRSFATTVPVVVDLFHDIACPWCRIGKAHLDQAIERWGKAPVLVRYHPFLLNPGIPEEGYPFLPYMREKFGRAIDPEQAFARVSQMGSLARLRFNFEKIQQAPNTLMAHVLVSLMPEDDVARIVDELYSAYFEHGRDIGDPDELVRIAEAVGLDRHRAISCLSGDEAKAETLARVGWATELGISGVPLFVFNGRFALSGAQPIPTIIAALDRALSDGAGSAGLSLVSESGVRRCR
jgi:predicted DsbA family dithiol-disulfide isomerase